MASTGHRYTRGELIDFLWKRTDELGYAPRTTHIKPGDPTPGTFRRVFGVGTWEEVIDTAGLTPMVVDKELPYGEIERLPWTRDIIIDFYRRLIDSIGILPTSGGDSTLYRQRRKLFPGDSSEQDVVEAAGFNYFDVRKRSREIRRITRVTMRDGIIRRMGIKS